MERMEIEEKKCLNCENEINVGDEIIIDANGCEFCSDRCLFEEYGIDYEEYLRTISEKGNYIDQGVFEIRFAGTYEGK